MTHRSTVLAHVASTLKAKPEVVATSALWYILWQSAAVWEALLSLVDEAGVVLPRELDLREQAGAEDLGRPDLAAATSDGATPLLIELKFGAALTANQPVGYLRQLPAGAPGALVFVAPRERLAQLWGELAARCAAAVALRDDRALPGGARAGTAGDLHQLVLVSWEDLLRRLEAAAERAAEPGIVGALAPIRGLYAMAEAVAFAPFEERELSPAVPKTLDRLFHLVDRLKDQAVNTPGSVLHGCFDYHRLKRRQTRWGHELRMHGLPAYLHVDLHKWADFERSPLWLSLYVPVKEDADRVWSALEDDRAETLFDDAEDQAIAVALLIPPDKGEDEVLAALEQQLHRIYQDVRPDHAQGTAAAEPAPSPVVTPSAPPGSGA